MAPDILSLKDYITIALMIALLVNIVMNWQARRTNRRGKHFFTNFYESDNLPILPFERKMRDPVVESVARAAIQSYRQAEPDKSRFVAYEKNDVITYITQRFNQITNKFIPENGNFEWRLGFYFGFRDDGKLNIYAMPTRYNLDTKEYLDFFDTDNDIFYRLQPGENTSELVYNFGHLDP